MEKQQTPQKEQRTNNPKKNNNHNRRYHNNHRKDGHKKETIPTWEFENKGPDLPETKADLMEILAETNPDEILMTSLVQQNKELKAMALKKTETIADIIEDTSENPDENIELSIEKEISPKIKINLARSCPICEKPIREIMYALHDYEHDQLAHFDCVYKKVIVSVKEKLVGKRYLAYLGSGSFGIMEPAQGKQPITLIEKIYPGAPLEELLHGDENIKDDEI